MEKIEILGKIEDCLIDDLGLEIDLLHESDELVNDLGLDGLEILDLASHIEAIFDMELSSQAIKKWKCVNDIVETIEEYNEFRA